ncbi:hypothetical protein OPKNFCMD_2612 [Methylobacterium crusticola]|uniref:Uncharacterized protein n=1 Tax=Methylobacterium crusticola TaxID=1697972 RepID=A0ABQ4QWZ2_9HYPH|nr:hypothetical protein [Methylobacterium crusticola]GJD49876.1 hypothetical protein OPKNFCMD_2612 [Methylobacterium crusticola]
MYSEYIRYCLVGASAILLAVVLFVYLQSGQLFNLTALGLILFFAANAGYLMFCKEFAQPSRLLAFVASCAALAAYKLEDLAEQAEHTERERAATLSARAAEPGPPQKDVSRQTMPVPRDVALPVSLASTAQLSVADHSRELALH